MYVRLGCFIENPNIVFAIKTFNFPTDWLISKEEMHKNMKAGSISSKEKCKRSYLSNHIVHPKY